MSSIGYPRLHAATLQGVSRARPLPETLWNAFERVCALMLLVALTPVLLIVGVSIWLLSGRSPLVAHRRIGQYGAPFRMLKFRTMWSGSDSQQARRLEFVTFVGDQPPPARKSGDDPRVPSSFARACRRFSIDELPQLAHVIIGEMSLVGPRPLTAVEIEEHYRTCLVEFLSEKPGLTGLWQTMGRSRLSYGQRRRLDLFLARHPSVGLKLRILGRTVPRVLTGRDAC